MTKCKTFLTIFNLVLCVMYKDVSVRDNGKTYLVGFVD